SFPRDGQCQKQSVQSRVVKTFPDETTRGQDQALLIGRNRSQLFLHVLSSFGCRSTVQHHQVPCKPFQPGGEELEMIASFREQERRAAFRQRAYHVVENERVAPLV